MIIAGVVDLLKNDAGVAAIIGDRAYPVQLPDAATFPACVVTKASGQGNYDLGGDVGLEDCRVQIDCYSADGYAAAVKLKKAVRDLLSGYQGSAGSGGPCAIQGAFCINDLDLTDPATERAGPRLRRRMLEFRIWNTEV